MRLFEIGVNTEFLAFTFPLYIHFVFCQDA